MSIKDSWKQIGKDLEKVGTDLGKTVVQTVKHGINAVNEWAKDEGQAPEPPKEDMEDTEPAETSANDTAKPQTPPYTIEYD